MNILSYKTSETGQYIILKTANIPKSLAESTADLANSEKIPAGKTYYYKLEITLKHLDNVDQTQDLNASLSTNFKIVEAPKYGNTYAVNISGIDLNINNINPNFASTALTDEGIYSMQDNYGTSYYYRGAVENNYVKFAGFYWRIIRFNGDGSMRIIYDGTTAYKNGESNVDRLALLNVPWNLTYSGDTKYLGYMYGGKNGVASTSKEEAQTNETSSNIKTQLEAWYKEKIVDAGHSGYVADVIFCNDRSTAESAGIWSNSDTALGYGKNLTFYGARSRLLLNESVNPTFICPENNTISSNNDWFTANATLENKGNGALEYPVGLITADEAVAAGGTPYNKKISHNNFEYYLYKGTLNWLFSPRVKDANSAAMYAIGSKGDFGDGYVRFGLGVAPVINLSPETVQTLIGDGTIGNEYRLPDDQQS